MRFQFYWLAGVLALSPVSAFACATCGCTLSTDAASGYSSQPGWRFNLDYSYIDQNALRSGTGSATARQVVDQPSDPSADASEIEKGTINRYLHLGIAYRPNADWGFALTLPFVDRTHATYGDQEPPFSTGEIAPEQISGSRLSSLGDVRFVVSYQGFLPTHNFGVQFGVKLPTGTYGGETEDGIVVGHPAHFSSGPFAGDALDTSLQAGTGSTDLIVGAYYYQPISQNFDMFVNGQYQVAIAEKMDRVDADFRPGNQLTMSAGLRYEAHPGWVPQLQVNFLHKSADQGALADRTDSAGTVAYLSPGITVSLQKKVQLYVFAQLPIYSDLDGYQLFPRWTANVGISAGF